MLEIKFKAKTYDNFGNLSNYVYGHYAYACLYPDSYKKHWIFTDKGPVQIDPETLQQVTDKLTRLVVVSDKAGRIIDNRFEDIELSFQDNNKTLKVFLKNKTT